MSARYLTTAEVAEILGCSVKTVYRMLDRGELMQIRVGSRIRIEAASLPTPSGPRRLPAPRPRKYGAPGTLTALAAEVKATMAAR